MNWTRQAELRDLPAVKRGEVPWTGGPSPIGWERVPEAGEGRGFAWRHELHRDFERALAETKLPERPDYEAVNHFLVKVRREMADRRWKAVNGNRCSREAFLI